jgi:hypothetical protein
MKRSGLWCGLFVCVAACTPHAEPSASPASPPSAHVAASAPSASSAAAVASTSGTPLDAGTSPHELGREGPLEEGLVCWEGMVRPTKGGYDVRGVTLDGAELPRRLAESAVDGLPKEPEWFLGAVVRITAELRKHEAVEGRTDAGLAVQTRGGTWFYATRVDRVELVARAQSIEGTLGRSKGLYSLGAYLIDRGDVDWSLRGAGEGSRVRLFGQPHTVKCGPQEQCLIGGTLPMFEIGRAEKLP